VTQTIDKEKGRRQGIEFRWRFRVAESYIRTLPAFLFFAWPLADPFYQLCFSAIARPVVQLKKYVFVRSNIC
jgi:hypothetical protein